MYINSDLSWLAFNKRVLEEALDKSNPLLERLRFLTIVSSNLDEFFEVKVAKLQEEMAETADTKEYTRLRRLLSDIRVIAIDILDSQYSCLNEEVLPELRKKGIKLLEKSELNEAQLAWTKDYFLNEVMPVLTPLAIDPSHPFPQLLNKSLNFVVSLNGVDSFGRNIKFAIVQAPRILPRIIHLPADISPSKDSFILLTNIIQLYMPHLFSGLEVLGVHSFRLTRNSNLYIDEDESQNLLESIEQELKTRHYGDVVRLEVTNECPPAVVSFLSKYLDLPKEDIYRVNGPVNLHRLASLLDAVEYPELRYQPYPQYMPDDLKHGQSIMQSIDSGDIMLHHPYDSFQPILDFVEEAANDPDVLAIKQTLYRIGSSSPIVDSLIRASENGKQVSVIMELKARFDEANNIAMAKKMEEAGVHVVYGIVGLKTHAKICLVAKKSGNNIKYYAHVGTGNYNYATSKLYTDISLLTADQELCADITVAFSLLTGVRKYEPMKKLLLAPFVLHHAMVENIDNEIANARAGKPARIVAKMNALLENSLIDKLYEASAAGVSITLIVRGMCGLVPGVKGLSENITVVSIIDRFLEHSRIFYFHNGGEPKVYIASADWMARNMFRRVEVCVEIENPRSKDRIINEILYAYQSDTIKARYMTEDGVYHRYPKKKDAVQAQKYLMEHRYGE